MENTGKKDLECCNCGETVKNVPVTVEKVTCWKCVALAISSEKIYIRRKRH